MAGGPNLWGDLGADPRNAPRKQFQPPPAPAPMQQGGLSDFDWYVQQHTGLAANIDRPSILPLPLKQPDGSREWTAPAWVPAVAKTLLGPSAAASGVAMDAQDVYGPASETFGGQALVGTAMKAGRAGARAVIGSGGASERIEIKKLLRSEDGDANASKTFAGAPDTKGAGGPVTVSISPEGKPYLLDGYHRVKEAELKGSKDVPVKYKEWDEGVQMLYDDERGFSGAGKGTFHSVDATEFQYSAKGAQQSRTKTQQGMVDILTPEKYADHQTFLNKEGDAGYAISADGELNSVIKHKASSHQGFTNAMLEDAVGNGAKWLNGFDTILPGKYAEGGFRPVARILWDDDMAPDGWDYAEMAKFNDGRPDLVFMVHDPSYKGDGSGGVMVDSYDAAMAATRREVADLAGGEAPTYDRQHGSRREYTGAAPDRSEFTHLRYRPKDLPERTQKALKVLRDPASPQRAALKRDIQAGIELEGDSWYNTEELRDWFIAEMGQTEGHAEWKEFMGIMGATSPGSGVMANIGNATAVRSRLKSDPTYKERLAITGGIQEARGLGWGREPGYGHLTQGAQELNMAKRVQGKWEGSPEGKVAPAKSQLRENPKPKGFISSLMGGTTNVANDLHLTRYMAMASNDPDFLNTSAKVSKEFMDKIIKAFPDTEAYFKERYDSTGKLELRFEAKNAVNQKIVPLEEIRTYPSVWAEKPRDNEYAAFEDFLGELGKEMGLTAAQVQASLWMGAAKHTGVRDSSQGTFMDLFRQRAQLRADITGESRTATIKRFINKGGLLSAGGAATAGMYGLNNQGEMEN